jgi:hypothetical protein
MLPSPYQSGLRKLVATAITLALIASLIAQPALAAAPRQATDNDPEATSYQISCQDGVCTVAFDLGEIDLETVVPKDMPVKLDLPAGAMPFLGKGGGIEIGDSINVTLPMGSIKFQNGDFSVHLDKDGNLDRLNIQSDSVTPNLNLGPNIQLGGPFAAQIGYDYGSTLDGFTTVLNPATRYLFFHLGGGMTLEANVPGSQDGEPVRFTIPEGDRISIVIDPQASLVYIDGQVTLNQLTDLGLALGVLGMAPATLPLLNGVVLPTRTTIGVGMLLSPDMSQNFLQLSGGMGINGGPLGKLLRIEGETLGFDGLLRVDSNGLLLGGVANSSINPDRVLDGRGELSVFIPFTSDELPYVQVGGALRVPVIGIDAEVVQQIGGGSVSEADSTNALLQSTAEAARSWWSNTGSWMSGLASSWSGGARSALQAVQKAADSTSDAISGGAKTIWNSTAQGATQAWQGAGDAVNAGTAGAAAAWENSAAAASCAAQQAQQLWCRTTGFCEVQEAVCD